MSVSCITRRGGIDVCLSFGGGTGAIFAGIHSFLFILGFAAVVLGRVVSPNSLSLPNFALSHPPTPFALLIETSLRLPSLPTVDVAQHY